MIIEQFLQEQIANESGKSDGPASCQNGCYKGFVRIRKLHGCMGAGIPHDFRGDCGANLATPAGATDVATTDALNLLLMVS
jgi:hypothetical protein